MNAEFTHNGFRNLSISNSMQTNSNKIALKSYFELKHYAPTKYDVICNSAVIKIHSIYYEKHVNHLTFWF